METVLFPDYETQVLLWTAMPKHLRGGHTFRGQVLCFYPDSPVWIVLRVTYRIAEISKFQDDLFFVRIPLLRVVSIYSSSYVSTSFDVRYDEPCKLCLQRQ